MSCLPTVSSGATSVRPCSAAHRGVGDALERGGHDLDLSVGEVIREIARDRAEVLGRGAAQNPTAFGAENDELSARVRRTRAPLDKALRLEPVDRPREAALGQRRALRKVRGPDPLGRSLIKGGEDVMLRERWPSRRLRLAVHCAQAVEARADERQPGAQLLRLEPPLLSTIRNRLPSQRVDCIINYRRSGSAQEEA